MKQIFFLILIITPLLSYTQEVIINTGTINKSFIDTKNLSENDTLELPFWDDFSDTQISPNPARWKDADVYINSNFCAKMPSVGFATFDACTQTGEFYPDADYQQSHIADMLSSQPINLNYPNNTSIYLSFYYRPQGYGDAPEPQDSLILEFYDIEADTWNKIWFAEGSYDTDFQYVSVQISDNKYLKKGFQFRFKNYVSLGSETYADLAGNCDFWHIDYIFLDKNRTSTNTSFPDISFAKPLKSLLENYEAVPWKHFKTKPVDKTGEFEIALQNHENITRSIDSLNFYSYHIENQSEIMTESGARNINPFGYLVPTNLTNLFDFEADDNDSASFEIRAELITDAYDKPENNIITYTQNFKNYYAYDDGSAEAAYGLYGNGTKYGSAAYEFESLKADSLIGVQIYFSRTLNDASQNYFWLDVRKTNGNGLPADTAFASIEGARPEYADRLNQFHYYEFEKPIYIADTFFVGWTQTNDEMLNVGFDWNRTANQHIYYNISGAWEQSEFEGALMIRPVFMGADISPETKSYNTENVQISPNPAENFIKFANINIKQGAKLTIINTQGQIVMQNVVYPENEIDISQLTQGLYFVKVTDGDKILNSKFIKQ